MQEVALKTLVHLSSGKTLHRHKIVQVGCLHSFSRQVDFWCLCLTLSYRGGLQRFLISEEIVPYNSINLKTSLKFPVLVNMFCVGGAEVFNCRVLF